MNIPENYGIAFTDGFDYLYNDRIPHILCVHGNVGFTFRRMRYNIGKVPFMIKQPIFDFSAKKA